MNKPIKDSLKSKFQSWYTGNVTQQLRAKSAIKPADLRLSTMKPLRAKWVQELEAELVALRTAKDAEVKWLQQLPMETLSKKSSQGSNTKADRAPVDPKEPVSTGYRGPSDSDRRLQQVSSGRRNVGSN